jgi:putative aldouronate transport system substrate-binding protein
LKKGIVACLVLILALQVLLIGCSKQEAASDSTSKESASEVEDKGEKGDSESASNLNPPGVFPIVKEKVTLRVLVAGNTLVEDFITNDFTKWFEE